MKFFDGWSPADGMDISHALRLEELVCTKTSLETWVCLDPRRPHHRPINGTMMTVRYSSPAPGVIRVSMVHHDGSTQAPISFLPDTELPVAFEETDKFVSMTSGNLTLRVHKGEGYWAEFLCEGRLLTRTAPDKLSYIVDKNTGRSHVKEEMVVNIGESLYGLGERFMPFLRNGQSLDMFNMNGGTNTDQVYKNIPLYLSNRGYGMLVNDTGRVSYEICTEHVQNVQFSVPGERLEYCIIAGPDMRDVLTRYTGLTGRPALPPAWSFGLWLTTSCTTDYDEETVLHFIDGMRDRQLPLRVFHYDCFWMKGGQWCNFQWDPQFFPDPEGMLQRVKARGVKICLWINPYIAQRSPLFEVGKRNGYFLRKQNGDVWQTDTWQPGMAIVDFTNPAACAWYKDELRRLLRMGADTFKTDFGERIPVDAVYFNGADPERMHNYYTHLYNQCVFELLKEELGEAEALVFARSATAGGQQFPVHWGGDNEGVYLSMAESLRGGLSLCMSGFGFWSHDISGFGSTATPDLYKRWVAFGMLSTHSRLHGDTSYRVPWLFDDEAVDVLRFFTNLKCRLMPYLYAQAIHTHTTGVPMLRAMVLEFQQDPTCAWLDRQYMLGDRLLVAPIMSEDGSVSFYVPDGQWTSLLSGKRYQGGRWYEENHCYMSLPLLVRPNTLLAMGNNDQLPDYDYWQSTTLHLYELDGFVQTEVPDPTGKTHFTATARQENHQVIVEVHGEAPGWRLCLHNWNGSDHVNGGNAVWRGADLWIEPLGQRVVIL